MSFINGISQVQDFVNFELSLMSHRILARVDCSLQSEWQNLLFETKQQDM